MIRTRRPRTIVEIGAGWSSSVARLACAQNGFGRIVCFESNPDDWLRAITGLEIIELPAREISVDLLNDLLRDGDMLFIDSTHAVKHDSDCLHLYLRLLPAILSDIAVHVHDIYLPDTLSLDQMRDVQIFWNEQYLLYAYMTCNTRIRPIFGSRYHTRFNSELLERFMHGRYSPGGASFWFEQAGAGQD